MKHKTKTALLVGGGLLAILFFFSKSGGKVFAPANTGANVPTTSAGGAIITGVSALPGIITSFKNLFTSGASVSNPNDTSNSADVSVGGPNDPAYDPNTGTWAY